MNGYYGGFPPRPMDYMQMQQMQQIQQIQQIQQMQQMQQMQTIQPHYAPTKYPPPELGFDGNLWAYMVVKQRGKTYTDQEWKTFVEALAKCDTADYYMEVKGISMSSHVWLQDSYFLVKMLATQNAYDSNHLVSLYNVEVKSQHSELPIHTPELEIRHVRDRYTPDVIFDTLSYHFISGGAIHNIRIGERQPQQQTMTVYVKFFAIETYLEAFLPHIQNLRNWIDPTNIQIKGIPSGGRRLFDQAVEFITGRFGKVFDTRFKDRPEGCNCYVRATLPGIAEEIRNFDWSTAPGVPSELQSISTSAPCYALWGPSGKPSDAFVDKALTGYMPYQAMVDLRKHMKMRYETEIKHIPHAVHNPQAWELSKNPVMAHQLPPPPVGNATPFSMAGNATPFSGMGNATPFSHGSATPFNAFPAYATTPYSSFAIDNQASTSIDPRFPVVPILDDPLPVQHDLPVDQSFSKRAQANSRKPSTATRGGRASHERSERTAPVLASRKDFRGAQHDAHDPAGRGDFDQDRYETGSQRSNQSRKSKDDDSIPSRPRSNRRLQEIYQLFPRDEGDEKTKLADELADYRRAYANSMAWNKSENIKRRQALEKIIQDEIDLRTQRRKALYEALNGGGHHDGSNGVVGQASVAEHGEALR